MPVSRRPQELLSEPEAAEAELGFEPTLVAELGFEPTASSPSDCTYSQDHAGLQTNGAHNAGVWHRVGVHCVHFLSISQTQHTFLVLSNDNERGPDLPPSGSAPWGQAYRWKFSHARRPSLCFP